MNFFAHFRLLAASACLISAPVIQAQQPDAEPPILPGPDGEICYLILEGTIGEDLEIRMSLTVTEDAVSGTYYYRKSRRLIALYGSRDWETTTITERSWPHRGWQELPHDGNTGTFKGELKLAPMEAVGDDGTLKRSPGPATFTGTWSSPDGKKSLPFRLTESYPAGAAKADLYSFSASWERKRGTETISRESSCLFPQLTGEAPGLERINAILREAAAGYPQIDFETESEIALVERIDPARAPSLSEVEAAISIDPVPRSEWDFELVNVESYHDEFEIVHNEGGYVSIRFFHTEYTGGAHGNHWDSHATFDIRTGQVVPIGAVLKPGYEAPLSEVAMRVARKNWGLKADQPLSEGPVFEDSFDLNDNWFLTPDGIGFSYRPYEIGPYVSGFINFSLSREEISDWIAPGSPLEKAVSR